LNPEKSFALHHLRTHDKLITDLEVNIFSTNKQQMLMAYVLKFLYFDHYYRKKFLEVDLLSKVHPVFLIETPLCPYLVKIKFSYG